MNELKGLVDSVVSAKKVTAISLKVYHQSYAMDYMHKVGDLPPKLNVKFYFGSQMLSIGFENFLSVENFLIDLGFSYLYFKEKVDQPNISNKEYRLIQIKRLMRDVEVGIIHKLKELDRL